MCVCIVIYMYVCVWGGGVPWSVIDTDAQTPACRLTSSLLSVLLPFSTYHTAAQRTHGTHTVIPLLFYSTTHRERRRETERKTDGSEGCVDYCICWKDSNTPSFQKRRFGGDEQEKDCKRGTLM